MSDAGEQGQEISRSGEISSSQEESSTVAPEERAQERTRVTIEDNFDYPSLAYLTPEVSDRATSKSRRLEYFRSGADADYEVHVLSTCAASDDSPGSVCYKKFPCHRLFLATASEQLEQDVCQSKQCNGVLQINGVSTESVEIFLEFIYTFDVSSPLVQLALVGDIFILSSAYTMPELLSCFMEKLKTQDWPLDGILPAFDLAFRCNIGELERACMEVGKVVIKLAFWFCFLTA